MIESPLNYQGSKFKLLPLIFNQVPKSIDRFIDIFAGGFNVGINAPCDDVIYNDHNFILTNLIHFIVDSNKDILINDIKSIIDQYQLKKNDKQSFNKLRSDYNKNPNNTKLITLIIYAYNNQLRFNNKHEFNSSVGTNSLNDKIINKLINFNTNKNVIYQSNDFTKFFEFDYKENDLVYIDPPYLITTATYNDGSSRGFPNWSIKQENQLINYLKFLNENGINFIMNNITHHKNKTNDILIDAIKSLHLNVIEINDYKRKELIIKNF
jgi:DNA adenine methylase Dam